MSKINLHPHENPEAVNFFLSKAGLKEIIPLDGKHLYKNFIKILVIEQANQSLILTLP
jgi:hypothetical protein